jgi:hypothetical protein
MEKVSVWEGISKRVKLISRAGKICVSRNQKKFDVFAESEKVCVFRWSKFAEYKLNYEIFLGDYILT